MWRFCFYQLHSIRQRQGEMRDNTHGNFSSRSPHFSVPVCKNVNVELSPCLPNCMCVAQAGAGVKYTAPPSLLVTQGH